MEQESILSAATSSTRNLAESWLAGAIKAAIHLAAQSRAWINLDVSQSRRALAKDVKHQKKEPTQRRLRKKEVFQGEPLASGHFIQFSKKNKISLLMASKPLLEQLHIREDWVIESKARAWWTQNHMKISIRNKAQTCLIHPSPQRSAETPLILQVENDVIELKHLLIWKCARPWVSS